MQYNLYTLYTDLLKTLMYSCFFYWKQWKSSDPEACSNWEPTTVCNGQNTRAASEEAQILEETSIHKIH